MIIVIINIFEQSLVNFLYFFLLEKTKYQL